jgi:hypothetical protein
MLLRFRVWILEVQWFFLKRKLDEADLSLRFLLGVPLAAVDIPALVTALQYRQTVLTEVYMLRQKLASLHLRTQVAILRKQAKQRQAPNTVSTVPQSSDVPHVVQSTSDADTLLH